MTRERWGHAGWPYTIARAPRMAVAVAALLAAVLIVGAVWRLARPGARFGPQDGTWRRVQINGDLYVGVDPSYPPLAEWTPDGIVGLEADVAREIGRRLGVETHILIMGYDSLYDALYTGQVDMVIAALRRDSTRTHWVAYTRPYFEGGMVLVSRADGRVDSMRGLDGAVVAVELASASDQTARRWQRRLHSLDIRHFLLPEEALQAVQAGTVDAALVDMISARLYLPRAEGLVLAAEPVVADPYVAALRRENFRLRREVDAALAAMHADGTLDAIIDRWL